MIAHGAMSPILKVLLALLLGMLGIWQGPRLVKWMVKSFADQKAANGRFDAAMDRKDAMHREDAAGYYDGGGNGYDNEKGRDLSESSEDKAWRSSGSAFD